MISVFNIFSKFNPFSKRLDSLDPEILALLGDVDEIKEFVDTCFFVIVFI